MRETKRIVLNGGLDDKCALSLPVFEQMKRDELVYGLSYRRTADPEAFSKFSFAHELIARLEARFENQIAQLFENQIGNTFCFNRRQH